MTAQPNVQLSPHQTTSVSALQVIQPQDALDGSCPVLRIQAAAAPAHPTASPATLHDSPPIEQHLIPWVPAIVQSIHPPSRTVVITPTPGLLELGRQQQLLERLKPELMAYGKPAAGSMAERLGQHFMPTKRQLIASGREDVVKMVTAAGGFIHVAHLLGLRAKRKPEGQGNLNGGCGACSCKPCMDRTNCTAVNIVVV